MGGKWLIGITGALGGVKASLLAISRISLIAGLVELQKYAAEMEKKYAWLKDNPVTNFLNNGTGTDTTTELGKKFHDWVAENTGIELPRGDGYKSLPRGVRNNNPGNLNFANQAGATKESGENGRFAVFGSMQEGAAALYRQLQLYMKRGTNTLSGIVNKYAPAGDNNNVGAYISALMKATGKGANEVIDSGDTGTIARLMKGIVDHENGKGYVSASDIMGGIQLGSGAAAMRGGAASASSGPQIHIGEMNVQSTASNVQALGTDVMRNVQRNRLVTPSMSGQG